MNAIARPSQLTAETLLPPDFRDLEPYADWALPTEGARYAKRIAHTVADLKGVYEALAPRVEAIMKYLDGFVYGKPLPKPEQRLYHLALAFMEISHPVELGWDEPANPEGFPVTRLQVPDRDPAM